MFVYIYGFRLWRKVAFVVDFSGMLHLNSFFAVFFFFSYPLFFKGGIILSREKSNLLLKYDRLLL